MYLRSSLILCLAAATGIYGFPVMDLSALPIDPAKIEQRQSLFNPSTQAVDLSGKHAWQAPGSGDLRGPCPGLNALADHGFISRNGYTNVVQLTAAMEDAYNMTPDLGSFLALLGASLSGDGINLSIGGPPPAGLLTNIGLLGAPQGLDNSHNRFEGDQSHTRNDLYQTGDAISLSLPFFTELLNMPNSNGIYDIDVIGQHCVNRFNYCIANNPYFFKGALGLILPEGTGGFVAHVFANHTEECPHGCLDAATLKSFYAISGSGTDLTYSFGHERIPNNWYKYPAPGYSLASILSDIVYIHAKYPEETAFGGNTGTVNSFTGLDIYDLTGGIFNAATLTQGNNLACLLFQITSMLVPDLITNGGVISNVLSVSAKVTSSISSLIAPLSCPQLRKINQQALKKFRGWNGGKQKLPSS